MLYAISGKKGFGIYDVKEKYETGKSLLGRCYEGQFDNFFHAFQWATQIYNDLQDDFDNAFFGSSSDIKINWVLFSSKIRKQNLESEY